MFEEIPCLKAHIIAVEQPCHSEEPVHTLVTRESVLLNFLNREYGLPRRFAPRNDRAKSIILYCAVDFWEQKPMLVIPVDKIRLARQSGIYMRADTQMRRIGSFCYITTSILHRRPSAESFLRSVPTETEGMIPASWPATSVSWDCHLLQYG